MNTSLIVLIVLAALFVVGLYHKLVGLRNRFKNAYTQIDVQLKWRYDLIPIWSKPRRATSNTNATHSKTGWQRQW